MAITLRILPILILTSPIIPLKIIYTYDAFQLLGLKNRSSMLVLNFGIIFHMISSNYLLPSSKLITKIYFWKLIYRPKLGIFVPFLALVYYLPNLSLKKRNAILALNMQNIYEYFFGLLLDSKTFGPFAAARCYFLYRANSTKLQ